MADGQGQPQAQPERREHRHDRNDNTIYIGSKPPMNYVMAVITQFHNGNSEVLLKSRGRAISCAVDVAEIVRNRFLLDVKVAGIQIGTETVTSEKGEKMNVSSIEIKLTR